MTQGAVIEADDQQHVVVVERLTRRFGPLTALDDVSLAVDAGEVVALLGHNGAGKTTLLRLLNGLLRPTAGVVRTLGLDPVVDGQAVREATGVLTEYPALDGFLTARENLQLHGAIHDLDPDEVRRLGDELLARLGLADKATEQTRNLSAGLKQRVALARALLHRPALLLLDEPTSNLDPIAARQVRELVAQLAREDGTAVVLSTHNLAEAAQVADRVAVIQQGRLLAIGRPAELAPETTVRGVALTVAPAAATHAAAVATEHGFHARSATAGGATLEVAAAGDDVPRLVEALVKGGVAVHAVVPLEPSLEDVYVALHSRETPWAT